MVEIKRILCGQAGPIRESRFYRIHGGYAMRMIRAREPFPGNCGGLAATFGIFLAFTGLAEL